MIALLLHRLCRLLVSLFILTLISFCILHFLTHRTLVATQPVWLGYLDYIKQIIHGNFGVSNINGQPILHQLKEVFPATIELCLIAFLLALLFGIPLGIIAGVMQKRWPDILISTIALIGFSLPVFWFALCIMLFFALYLGWFPISGNYDLLYTIHPVTGITIIDAWLSNSPYRHDIILSSIKHLVLPIVALRLAPTAEVIRLMRLKTCEIYEKNYIKAAYTRGSSTLTIIWRHLLRNALPPLIAQLGLKFSSLLNLTIVVEVVFNWPGLGNWLINAVQQQDYTAISAGVLIIGSLVIIINILTDTFGAISNPLRSKVWYAD